MMGVLNLKFIIENEIYVVFCSFTSNMDFTASFFSQFCTTFWPSVRVDFFSLSLIGVQTGLLI